MTILTSLHSHLYQNQLFLTLNHGTDQQRIPPHLQPPSPSRGSSRNTWGAVQRPLGSYTAALLLYQQTPKKPTKANKTSWESLSHIKAGFKDHQRRFPVLRFPLQTPVSVVQDSTCSRLLDTGYFLLILPCFSNQCLQN